MNQVTSSIRQDVMKSITGKKDCLSYEYTSKLKEIIEKTAGEFLEANRKEIIEEVSKKLADKLSRRKVVNDMLNSTINSLLDN